jgi:tetratricopeptide repeat protein 8
MIATEGGPFIRSELLDLRKYAQRPQLARVLCDYIVYVDHNMRQALDLATHASAAAGEEDWWWQERLGKAAYQLGLMRDAAKQFSSALKSQVCEGM